MIKHTIFLKTIHQYVHSIVLLATSYTIESHHVDLHFWIDQTPAYFFLFVYSSPTWDLHIFFVFLYKGDGLSSPEMLGISVNCLRKIYDEVDLTLKAIFKSF